MGYAGKLVCSNPDCDRSIENHAWGKIKSNWFFQKDGKAFCPDHHPEWVKKWRR